MRKREWMRTGRRREGENRREKRMEVRRGERETVKKYREKKQIEGRRE